MNQSNRKTNRPFARKRFGQNFLQNSAVINQILEAADPTEEDHVIEIGPGRGALTSLILDNASWLTAIEIDRDLSKDLRSRYQDDPKFHLIEADILKLDWQELVREGVKNKLIANLPYNISTPIFFKMVQYRSHFDSFTIMVQKEVALRLQHTGIQENLKQYGILSVIATTVFCTETICEVPASSFIPQPKVDSMVIRLTPKPIDLPNEKAFFGFVKRVFNQRRKQFLPFLKKNETALYDKLSPKTLECLYRLRPENITPAEYVQLFYENRIER